MAQNAQSKIFPKKSLRSILRLYVAVTKKIHAPIFHKTWKPHFGPILGQFGPKNSKQDFSQENHLGQF